MSEEFPVPGTAVGRAADLPWLCPSTESLIGLAENSADLARLSAADPALLAFLLRFAPAADPAAFSLAADRFRSPLLPETAIAYLDAVPNGRVAVCPRLAEVATAAAEF